MRVSEKFVSKIFNSREILSRENFYKFISRKKVIVFVPHKFVELLTSEMSAAGAGLIGNYRMCSFRTEGIGTFMPDNLARPYSGKKNFLSREEEIKLEMECDPGKINEVIDALIKNHPYEEIAYEVYDFKKRENKVIGDSVVLKNDMKVPDFLMKVNSKLDSAEIDLKNTFRKIAIIDIDSDETIIESAKFTNCEYIFNISNKNYKLFKI